MALAPLTFLDGQNLTTAEQQAELLYIAYFGRSGDPAGLQNWENNLNSGSQTIDQEAISFGQSAEAENLYGFLGSPDLASSGSIQTFITQIYQDLFNRNPDSPGLDYWTAQLQGYQTALNDDTITPLTFQTDVADFIMDVIRGAQNSTAGQDIAIMEDKETVAQFFSDQIAASGISYIPGSSAAIDAFSHLVVQLTDSSFFNTVAAEEAAINAFILSNKPNSPPAAAPLNSEYLIACQATYCEQNLAENNNTIPTENALQTDFQASLASLGAVGDKILDVVYTPTDGFYGAAFIDSSGNLVIAYEGTLPNSSSTFGSASLHDDALIFAQKLPTSVVADARAFAQQAEVMADGTTGFDDHTYITGHSLGGLEAEYVAANSGSTLSISGGATFGAPGLPGYSATSANMSNITDYVDYGDPVGNYASHMPPGIDNLGFAPSSNMDHVGTVVPEGNPLTGVALGVTSELPSLALDLDSPLLALAGAGGTAGFLYFHTLSHYAADLGVTLGSVSSAAPPTPEEILASLDAGLGAPGAQDFAAATSTSVGEIATPTFVINENTAGTTITITQLLPTAVQSDLGTDVIQLDPSTFVPIQETFQGTTPADTNIVVQLLPDADALGDQQAVSFVSQSNDTLVVDNPGSYTGTIGSFVRGDTIDLAGVIGTAATLGANNVLTVQESGGGSINLDLAPTQNYSGDNFAVASDGNGGTDVTITPPAYTFTTIDDPLGIATDSFGINNNGQIVGVYADNFDRYHAFLYSGGQYSTININVAQAESYDYPFMGINDVGEIVFNVNGEGYLYNAGAVTQILTNGILNNATGINNQGQIVGVFGATTNQDQGFLYNSGVMETIDDPLGTITEALGINNKGQIVGYYGNSTGGYGFVYNNGVYTTLSDPLGTFTVATGINDAGQIVGYYEDSSHAAEHGFIYSGGQYSTLNVPSYPNTNAFSINNAGQISGVATTTNTINDVGFLATPIVGVSGTAQGAAEYHFS